VIGKDFKAVVVGQTLQRDTQGQWPIAFRFGTGGGSAVMESASGDQVQLDNIANAENFPCTARKVVSVTGTVAGIVAVYEFDV